MKDLWVHNSWLWTSAEGTSSTSRIECTEKSFNAHNVNPRSIWTNGKVKQHSKRIKIRWIYHFKKNSERAATMMVKESASRFIKYNYSWTWKIQINVNFVRILLMKTNLLDSIWKISKSRKCCIGQNQGKESFYVAIQEET